MHARLKIDKIGSDDRYARLTRSSVTIIKSDNLLMSGITPQRAFIHKDLIFPIRGSELNLWCMCEKNQIKISEEYRVRCPHPTCTSI